MPFSSRKVNCTVDPFPWVDPGPSDTAFPRGPAFVSQCLIPLLYLLPLPSLCSFTTSSPAGCRTPGFSNILGVGRGLPLLSSPIAPHVPCLFLYLQLSLPASSEALRPHPLEPAALATAAFVRLRLRPPAVLGPGAVCGWASPWAPFLSTDRAWRTRSVRLGLPHRFFELENWKRLPLYWLQFRAHETQESRA